MAEADRLVQPATTTAPVTYTTTTHGGGLADPYRPGVVDPHRPGVVDPHRPGVVDPHHPGVVDPHHPGGVVDPHHPGAVDPHHKHSSGGHIAKGLIAFLEMALALILIGLIAFIANGAQLAFLNSDDDANSAGDDSGASNGSRQAFLGLNNAGLGMLFFGLIFAVLQAVTAAAMIAQISLVSWKFGHAMITSLLKVTTALGFLAMGFACRHISLGEPAGADPDNMRITHTIEAFLIINWILTLLFLILSLLGLVNWNGLHDHNDHLTRQHALSVFQFLAALLLVGLVAGEFQMLTNNGNYQRNALHGTTGFLFLSFAALFAVLQLMSGLTMYQQCMRQTPYQTSETVHGVLKVAFALGLLAFGFACRHIWLGSPQGSSRTAQALVIAIEAWVIINFLITLACMVLARRYDWSHLVVVDDEHHPKKRMGPHAFAIIQTILAIVLIGLLAAEAQHLTGQSGWNPFSVGLNNAGLFMLGFGLIFAVLEAAAGFAMIEHMLKFKGTDANVVFVTNKVALAVGALAMGFACRHIYLNMRDGHPQGSSDSSMALVHAIEAFLIINFFVTWLIQSRSSSVHW